MSTEINFTMNGSLMMDDDVFSDATDDESYSYERNLYGDIIFYFLDFFHIIECVIALLAVASDIYLIVIISKFKNLQNRINNFIRLYAIFNILYMVLPNLLTIIVELAGAYSYANYCFIYNLDHLLITLSYYTLTFTALDWYMLNYHPNIYGRYPKSFKYGAYILFALAIPKWIATSTACFINHWHHKKIKLHLELTSFLLCIIIMTSIMILKHGKVMSSETRKTEYAFIVPRTVLLLSLLSFIVKLVLSFLIDYLRVLDSVGVWFSYNVFRNILLFSAPVVMLYQLTKLNKNFKSAFIKSCKKKRIKNYDDGNLDGDSINETPPSNVTFDRNSKVIVNL